MALWVCTKCTTKYAVGLFKCPRCLNTEFFEDGDPMAKITRHGGASDKTLPAPEVRGEHGPEVVELPQGGVVPSPEALREHARNLAEPDFSESLARLEADGDEPESEPATAPAPEPEPEADAAPDYEAWTVEQLKEQLDARGLPKTGKKDDLVLRLLEDDEE